MTLKKLALPLLVLAASTVAQAQTGLYVGGSLGESRLKDNSSLGLTDRSDTGIKLYGGYSLTPNIAIEAGRVRLGRFNSAAGDATARGNFVDAVGTWPLGNGFSLLGRVGVFDGKLIQSTGATDRTTSPKFGAGVQYELAKNVALRGEWERYRLDSFNDTTSKTDLYSVGVNFRF